MTDHHARWFLDRSAIRAHLVGDVLSVELRGRFTARRLHMALHALRKALERKGRDYGALVINALEAQMAMTLPELSALWQTDECPLAARPCAVVYDSSQLGAGALFEHLGIRLAAGQPARIIGAFAGSLMVAAVHWAQQRAKNYQEEQARREARASSRASSGKRGRKPGSDPHRS